MKNQIEAVKKVSTRHKLQISSSVTFFFEHSYVLKIDKLIQRHFTLRQWSWNLELRSFKWCSFIWEQKHRIAFWKESVYSEYSFLTMIISWFILNSKKTKNKKQTKLNYMTSLVRWYTSIYRCFHISFSCLYTIINIG